MSKSQYDTDVTTFSPQGRLFQIEYAIEAVKQGSASIGIKNKNYAVLISLKRLSSELSSYQEKIFKIDNHIGIAVSGLISDARILSKYIHDEALNYKYIYSKNIQLNKLVVSVADKSQVYTQTTTKRPYGVGILYIGYDKTGAHLYETDPSGNYYEYNAQAIGSRSQTAKTYLEKHLDTFDNCTLEELIKHACVALRGTAQTGEFNERSVSIAYVGKDTPFKIASTTEVHGYTSNVDAEYKEEKKEEVPAAPEGSVEDDELAMSEAAVNSMDQS